MEGNTISPHLLLPSAPPNWGQTTPSHFYIYLPPPPILPQVGAWQTAVPMGPFAVQPPSLKQSRSDVGFFVFLDYCSVAKFVRENQSFPEHRGVGIQEKANSVRSSSCSCLGTAHVSSASGARLLPQVQSSEPVWCLPIPLSLEDDKTWALKLPRVLCEYHLSLLGKSPCYESICLVTDFMVGLQLT